ncbi:MAG TPA: transglycosylase SLT domain-containing protein [Thermoleophilaceae bacterium]|jgi:soluble lytic murein transglycosylase-like protein
MGRLATAAAVVLTLALAAPAAAQEEQPTGGAAPPGQPSGAQAPVEGMPAVPFANEIATAADANGVDRLLLAALVHAESNFDPEATSRSGARGLAQLMPSTARSLGLRVDLKRGVDDRIVPARSLDAGARYLRSQLDRFRGKIQLSLAAYNAGPRAVIRYRGIPPYRETRAYVRKVVGYRNEYRAELAAARDSG